MSVTNGGDSIVTSPERRRIKASVKKGTMTVNRGSSKLSVMKPSSSMKNLVPSSDSGSKPGLQIRQFITRNSKIKLQTQNNPSYSS